MADKVEVFSNTATLFVRKFGQQAGENHDHFVVVSLEHYVYTHSIYLQKAKQDSSDITGKMRCDLRLTE